MITFPNAKINLGLSVVKKREDGYHDLETVFYPVSLCDILEFIPNDSGKCILFSHGNEVECKDEDNLVVKAYNKIKALYDIPGMDIHMKKIIPSGAGLGGGSSDATFTIRALNDICELNIPVEEQMRISSELGADCPFFCINRPVYAEGTGNVFSEIICDLSGYKFVIIKPDVFVSTKDAFSNIVPCHPEKSVKEIVENYPVEQWKDLLSNDFEKTVFSKFPEIGEIKRKLYDLGAVYSSMSGSGSSVFGIFREIDDSLENEINENFKDSFIWIK